MIVFKIKNKQKLKEWVFWVNIAKSEVNLRYSNCLYYLRFWGERLNFDITVAGIQPKVWERRRKRWREIMLNFGNGDTEFPVPNSIAWVCVEWPKWKEKKNWQTNCGNAIAEIGGKKFVTIVAMALPKMGGEKMWFRNLGRVKKKVFRSLYFHNKSHMISYF